MIMWLKKNAARGKVMVLWLWGIGIFGDGVMKQNIEHFLYVNIPKFCWFICDGMQKSLVSRRFQVTSMGTCK